MGQPAGVAAEGERGSVAEPIAVVPDGHRCEVEHSGAQRDGVGAELQLDRGPGGEAQAVHLVQPGFPPEVLEVLGGQVLLARAQQHLGAHQVIPEALWLDTQRLVGRGAGLVQAFGLGLPGQLAGGDLERDRPDRAEPAVAAVGGHLAEQREGRAGLPEVGEGGDPVAPDHRVAGRQRAGVAAEHCGGPARTRGFR